MLILTALNSFNNFLIFLIFTIFVWIIPGNYLIRQKKLAFLDRVFLSASTGFSAYVFVVFITRLLKLPFWISLIFFLSLSVKYLTTRRLKLVLVRTLSASQKLLLVIALLAMFLQGLVLFSSGIKTEQGIKFNELSYHDSIWHIYLINELKDNFPPRHGGFSGSPVRNYHFLLDLTSASIGKYLPISTFELYYRLMPVFVSLLLSLGTFVITRKISRSETIANLAVFFTLFSGNAAWFVKFFRGEEFQVSANTFMLDPIIDLLQNPHAVIVFPLMLAGIYWLTVLDERRNTKASILTALVLGVIIGFKAWGGVLMNFSLGATALYFLLFKKRTDLLITWFLTLLISIAIFLPVYDAETAVGPIFIPGWLLKRMVEDPDRVNLVNHFFLEQHYRATNNIIRLIILNSYQVAIYIFGNLWIRTLGLIYLLYSLFRPTPSKIFSVCLFFSSLLIPLLFNQGSMAYDIIQFAPYSQVIISIFTALSLHILLRKFSLKSTIAVITVLAFLSVPSNFVSIKNRFKGNNIFISNQELQAFDWLKEQTEADSVILVYPSKLNISTSTVAALSQRPTFFSANTFSRITGENFLEREEQLKNFFKNSDTGFKQQLISENRITYIYLTGEENLLFNKDGLSLKEVFKNEKTVIYQII